MMDLDLIKARLGLAGANFPTHLAHALVAEVERLWESVEKVSRRLMRISELTTAISAAATYEREKNDDA